jgi:hypothetical protein
MSQRSPNNARKRDAGQGTPPSFDLWGVRAPSGPPHTVERRSPPTLEETDRLVQLLLAEPAVAGRFHGVKASGIASRGSGATTLHADWDGPIDGARTTPGRSDSSGSLPAIVKLGAGQREAHWAMELRRHAPSLVPNLYAAGFTLGGELSPWLIMERCPYLLDYAWFRAPWGHRLFAALLDAGVRFHLTSRRIAPRVGVENVGAEWLSGLVRRALTSDPRLPGARELAERVVERQAEDWKWVLAVCEVELAHGDLHLANAVWRTEPSDPQAQALLVDYTPYALPWAMEAAYCQALYWGGWTRHPGHITTTHEMASLRAAYGLQVPAPADVDRLAALCEAWQAMRLWPTRTHHHAQPAFHAAVAKTIERAALA